MAYTRSQLQGQIDALFVENGANAIDAGQVNTVLTNILDNVTLQDESATVIQVAGVNCTDVDGGVKVSDVKVVGAQQANIPAVDPGTGTLADCIAAVNLIIAAMITHGLISDAT